MRGGPQPHALQTGGSDKGGSPEGRLFFAATHTGVVCDATGDGDP
jgi:hypothetical protein